MYIMYYSYLINPLNVYYFDYMFLIYQNKTNSI